MGVDSVAIEGGAMAVSSPRSARASSSRFATSRAIFQCFGNGSPLSHQARDRLTRGQVATLRQQLHISSGSGEPGAASQPNGLR